MPTMTSTDGAETAGPNASLPFGEATQAKALQRQAGMFAHGGQTQPGAPPTPQAGPGGPGGPQPGSAPGSPGPGQQAPAPPVQPDPMFGKDGSLQMDGVFSQPHVNDNHLGWREELASFAKHPQAGPWLKEMARISTNKTNHPSGKKLV